MIFKGFQGNMTLINHWCSVADSGLDFDWDILSQRCWMLWSSGRRRESDQNSLLQNRTETFHCVFTERWIINRSDNWFIWNSYRDLVAMGYWITWWTGRLNSDLRKAGANGTPAGRSHGRRFFLGGDDVVVNVAAVSGPAAQTALKLQISEQQAAEALT